MDIINLRMREVRKLKTLPIEKGVLNTEALMLILKKKFFSNKVDHVFKYLDAQEDPDVMAKKIFTVTTMNIPNEYQKIDSLVFPDSIIYVDGNIAGFGIPLIRNHKNLGAIINNPSISLDDKLFYLVQLGNIIDKVQRTNTDFHRFQFGDLNEYNFVVDDHMQVKAIDLDSAYLGVGEPLNMAYYLLRNPYIASLSDKYKTTKDGIVIPTDDTDLYCYNMIVLNALAKENIYRYDIDTYYSYLEYIRCLGIPKELIEVFHNIYIPKNNSNPKDILFDIDISLEKELDFKVFQKKYMKK